jgi:sec-independent protein translocase protein TatA
MSLGTTQLILILCIVLVFFGAGKLPSVMGDLGKGMRNFRRGLNAEDENAGQENKEPNSNLSELADDSEEKSQNTKNSEDNSDQKNNSSDNNREKDRS